MKRVLRPELLDTLPPQDPRAERSRRDLHRLNTIMGHPGIMAGAMASALNGEPSVRLAEIGAGDGAFLLRLAGALNGRWKCVEATVVDRLDAFDRAAETRFRNLGWRVAAATGDAGEWLKSQSGMRQVVIANLFLHHFEAPALADLLRQAASAARTFIALEPRRGWWPLFASRMLWAIGCNDVTRHDAPASVCAGFSGSELSALWPDPQNWRLTERRAGVFSHLFIAQRKQ